MEEKALKTIEEYGMLQQGDTVAVGVSGGADSVALLDFLLSVKDRWGLTLLVCHLNHSLRGEESLRDQRFVEELAGRLGLLFHLGTVDAAAEAAASGKSVEEVSRELRYSFFAACAGETGKIATAHTLSDSMETLLLNLTRGTGVRGLRGIPPVRDNIIRPLCGVTRREVLDYCARRGLAYVTDSTNFSLDYTRNRIRLEVLPVLEEINPGLADTMAGFILRMGEQWELVEGLAAEAMAALREEDRLDRQGFLRLPKPVADRLLQRLLEEAQAEQSARILRLMGECAAHGSGAVEVAEGVYFYADAAHCGLRRRQEPASAFCIEITGEALKKGGIFPTAGGKSVKIAIFHDIDVKNREKFYKVLLKNALDYDRIDDNVILRGKQDGDRISLWESAGTRPLKKLYNEAGIPPGERGRLSVLADDKGLLWAEGFGPACRVRPNEGTRSFLTIEVLEDKQDG